MATDIIVRAVPGGFMCANAIESEKAEQLRGKELMATFTQSRNIRFHKKFFALLGVARDMADTDYNAEQFRAYVTVGAGYCEFIQDSEGGVVAIPKSISFAKMDETEFNRLYNDALTFICQKWALDTNQVNQIVSFM